MKRLRVAFLTGCTLLSQPGPVAAQGGVAHGPTIRSLFSHYALPPLGRQLGRRHQAGVAWPRHRKTGRGQ